MIKRNYQLDYLKCTAEELRSFIKARSGKNCTSNNVKYLAAQLRALDRTITFRFLDLPTELKLEVYGELLDFKNPIKSGQRHLQILRTCKEIRREAEPELYKKVTLSIMLAAYCTVDGPWERAETSVRLNIGGVDRMRLRDPKSPLWVFEKLPKELRKVWNINLAIKISTTNQPRTAPASFEQFLHILFGITAALRKSQVRSLKVCLENGYRKPLWTVATESMIATLWPLYRIKTKVAMCLQGFPDDVSEYILSRRLEQDSVADSITRYRRVIPTTIKVLEILRKKDRQSTIIRKHVGKDLATLRRHIAEVRRLGPPSTIHRDDDSKACETLRDLQRFLDRPSIQALLH